MLRYTPDDYNQYDVLNVPFSLIVANLYLLKHYFIFALPIMAKLPMLNMVAQSLEQVIPSEDYSSGALLYSCIPALLVLISMARRLPKSGSLLRLIWRQGRWLLLSSSILEIGLILGSIWFDTKNMNEMSLLFLYIDMVLIIFLLKSQRVKDVFTEFPQPLTKS